MAYEIERKFLVVGNDWRRFATAQAAIRHFDLGNLCEIAAEDGLQRDAAATSLRQCLSPACFFCGKIEHRLGTRRVVEQRPAKSDRA